MNGLINKMKTRFCQKDGISWPTYFLVSLFGLGSWLVVNGVWVELPVLVQHAPEFWKLPSIFAVVIQIANIGPFLHTILNSLLRDKIRDVPVIYGVLAVTVASCALLGFFWDHNGDIAGNEHSVALIILVFCAATVACTSSVTFLPFMADFRPEYMSAVFVGFGLSALLPSLLAIAQGINNNNKIASNSTTSNSTTSNSTTSNSTTSSEDGLNFGVNAFFFSLMAISIVSLLAFIMLNTLSFVRREKINVRLESEVLPREAMALDRSQEFELTSITEEPEVECHHQTAQTNQLIFLLVIQMWIHALCNGVVPSVQSFACIPYSYRTYHLALTLSNIVNPLASLVYYWLPTTSHLFVGLSTVVYTSLVGYILFVASLSSSPPLAQDSVGGIVIIVVNVVSVALVNYTKVVISTWMQDKGKSHLRWAGIALQAGSFLGALAIFFPVNVTDSFHQPSW